MISAVQDRTDHKGIVYSSVAEMLRHYNLDYRTYSSRLKRGFTKSQALTSRSAKDVIELDRTDHLGNVYPTKKAMCAAYGIALDTYNRRRERGWSVERSLTADMDYRYGKKCVDFKGTEYENQKKMCEAHGVSYSAYILRISHGWTQEQALTCTQKNKRTIRNDFDGISYSSVAEMTENYNVNHATYLMRKKSGYSDIESLGVIPLLRSSLKNVNLLGGMTLVKCIGGYFVCVIDQIEDLYTKQEIITYCKDAYTQQKVNHLN